MMGDLCYSAEMGGVDIKALTGIESDFVLMVLEDFKLKPKRLEDVDSYYSWFDAVCKYLKDINNGCNQEFLRARVGDRYYGTYDRNSIYFRVSSFDFNWFDIIWKVLYENEHLAYITIETDTQSGRTYDTLLYQLDSGERIDQMPRDEFLFAKGKPLIEGKDTFSNKILERGGTLREAFGNFGPLHNNIKFDSGRLYYLSRHFRHRDGSKMTIEEFTTYHGIIYWGNDKR